MGSILGPALVTLLSASVDARTIFLIAAAVVLLTILMVVLGQAKSKSWNSDRVNPPQAI